MACLVNKTVVNPRYKKISPDNHYFLFHDGYFSNPPSPREDYYINVSCGRCINCFRKYMNQWRIRLLHECMSYSREQMSRTFFATLTIEPRYYTEKKRLLKSYIRKFLERVRYFTGHSPRHFIVTELGENTRRYHFHAIFFDVNFSKDLLYKYWKYGFVKVRNLHSPPYSVSQSIAYITSYITKGKKGEIDYVIPPEEFPIVLSSPGLGKAYVDKYRDYHHQNSLVPFALDVTGKFVSLPRYYRQKVFTSSELKFMKDDYFRNLSPDVIPDPPYFIGSVEYSDYTVYLSKCLEIKNLYSEIYGK